MLVTRNSTNKWVWSLELGADDNGQVLIDGDGTEGLLDFLQQAERDASCRVVVLRAPQGCQGLDMAFALDRKSGLGGELRAFAKLLKTLCRSELCTVAVVDGNISGGGVGLFAAADKVIAAEEASFSLPELVLGILPAMILPVLLRRMPLQKANYLAISPAIDANEARSFGLADTVGSDSKDLDRLLKKTLKHLLRLKPSALAQLKKYSEEIAQFECDRAIDLGAERTEALLSDSGNAEPIRAFLAGDPLPWFEKYRHEESAS